MFVIRAINITSQTITTIAGTANSPAWLDGVGVGAQFTSPYSIAMSANKQFLFIAEFSGLVRSLRLFDCAYRRFTPLLYCLTFFYRGCIVCIADAVWTVAGSSHTSPAENVCIASGFSSVSTVATASSGAQLFVVDPVNAVIQSIQTNGSFKDVAVRYY